MLPLPAMSLNEIKRQNILLGSLVELAQLINTDQDINTILETVKFTCMANFHPESVEIFITEDGEFRLLAGDNDGSIVRPKSDWVDALRQTGRPLNTEDLARLATTAAAPAAETPAADSEETLDLREFAVAVPVFAKEEMCGFIFLGPKSTGPYDEGDFDYLSRMSNITGTALENARLIADLRDLNVNLENKVRERTRDLEAARRTAEREREKSDRLLLNILPKEIAEEMKRSGIPEPLHYESVTVLFTDFVGFTQFAEKMSPRELVDELHECFSQFDAIMREHGLEKLKTIGDSYMCCGGIPSVNLTHPVDTVLAALKIQQEVNRTARAKEAAGRPCWQLRLGIHTGPLIAGVIGETKFAYDVWGDTVNTASRMESSGTAGKINISPSTFRLVRKFFECRYRGRIKAKNKGKLAMYYVLGIKPELAQDDDRTRPNDRFLELYEELRR